MGRDDPPLPVVACVDDFGASAPINEAVQALAVRGAISATSCLVGMAHCTSGAMRELVSIASLDVGLHLNLSEGEPVSASLRRHWTQYPRLAELIARCHLGLVPAAAIADECQAQFDRFVALAGRAPDFVDGHQHVHHLPGVRGAWLPMARAAGVRYVRDTGHVAGPGFALKRSVIERSGGRRLSHALASHGLAGAGPLFGVYDFGARDYRSLMGAWLAQRVAAREPGLLFCHPARPGAATASDPIGPAREREWRYFSSGAWTQDLAAAGVALSRGAKLWPTLVRSARSHPETP